MRAGNCIRYYQSFPSVIPVCRASSLRVTHPSALARLCKHRFAKDLHVLSILSAFILSQDQTLHSIYFHIFNFTFSLDENLILRIRVLDIIFNFYTLLLLLFLYHCPLIPFCIDEIYIIIIKFICQLLFWVFFKFIWLVYCIIKCNKKIYKKHSKNDMLISLTKLERIILSYAGCLCKKLLLSFSSTQKIY